VKAVLLLEDGTIFEGTGFGSKGHKCGEVVFNTSMTGYQEILTDPSYNEQIITMTYPLIGNYGTNSQDTESGKVFASGFIVKENCPVVGLEGVDTRKLVKHIRTKGATKGIISSTELSVTRLKKKLWDYPGLVGRDIVRNISTRKIYNWNHGTIDVLNGSENRSAKKYKVIAFDFGVKHNILRLLCSNGCDVKVVPATTSAKEVLSQKPDGIFLSNGPGDPAPISYAIETMKNLLGKLPVFGICLGHQILALALGGQTYKLKFGHRGANHPVKNMMTGAIEITTQNHGFCVDIDSLKDKDIELTHINLNDNTLEGIRSEKLSAFSVQYHPEASPGPHDSGYLFERFTGLMDQKRTGRKNTK
jgi:carbamoyl-phosphate synthase small subunit